MAHAHDDANVYYVPHSSPWPIVGAIGLFTTMLGVASWMDGAAWGMWVFYAGLAVTLFYVVRTHPFFGGSMSNSWFDINPISAGVFGVPLGFVVIAVVSLLTKPPPQEIQDLVDYVRYPDAPGQSRPHL